MFPDEVWKAADAAFAERKKRASRIASGQSELDDSDVGAMLDALDLIVFEWRPSRADDIDVLEEDTYQFYLSMRNGIGQRKPPVQAWGEIDGVPVG